MGGLRALATAALYLVLKSNGLPRPKIRLKKFSFSPKPVPTNIAKKLPSQRCSQPLFNFAHKWPTFAFTSKSGYTLGFRRRIAHNGSHGETGAFRMGVVSLPSERSARSRTSPGLVSERRTLPLLGLGRVYSRRTQKAYGTAMCLCASLSRRRRGPAGLRDLFCFCRNCGLYTLRSELSVRVRQGWYHYPRCALHVLETLDGRLSKGLICRFLRSGGRSSPHDSYFLANTQNFLLAVPVANAFALWYDKFSKSEFVNHLHRFFQF